MANEEKLMMNNSKDVFTNDKLQKLLGRWQCSVKRDSYSVDILMDKIRKGYERIHGGIVLKPNYQREYKFTVKKESSIIESILLEIPIPVIYLSQDVEQDVVLFNVIDGMHRLKSIERFINNEYKLTDLTILKDLNGKKFSQLPKFIQNKLQFSSQLEVNSIDISGNFELEYEVFLRFNQETNPLTKQELLEVMFRSEYSYWVKDELIIKLCTSTDFSKLFNNTGNRLKDKTLNYSIYACLAYAKYGLLQGKNDTPLYVAKYMKCMSQLTSEELVNEKHKTKEFIYGITQFYSEISRIEKIDRIFSKEFITKKYPQGNHVFLISFLIPLTLAYTYVLEKGIVINNMTDEDYSIIYRAIVKGMNEVDFGDFGGVSSTSYKVQNACFTSIKKSIDNIS